MKPRSPEEVYGPALAKAMEEWQAMDPWLGALKSGTQYQELSATTGQIKLKFFGKDYLVSHPQCAVRKAKTGQDAPIVTQIILLHYLINADGTPLADKWASFRQLPGGLAYEPVLKERANQPLERTFGDDLEGFTAAAEVLGGERLSFGDASFMFRILPRLRLAVILYVADEEFPASVNVLFDAAAANYLPTEDLTIVGGMLAGRLVKGS